MRSDSISGLRDDLLAQQTIVATRSPVYRSVIDALLELLDGPFANRLRDVWADRRFGAWYERPLLILASLRDDVLREGESHPLWAALGAAEATLVSRSAHASGPASEIVKSGCRA